MTSNQIEKKIAAHKTTVNCKPEYKKLQSIYQLNRTLKINTQTKAKKYRLRSKLENFSKRKQAQARIHADFV